MSRKKNRKKNFVKQIAVVNKTPVKQEEQMVQLDLGPRRSVAFIGSECYPFVKTGRTGRCYVCASKDSGEVKSGC